MTDPFAATKLPLIRCEMLPISIKMWAHTCPSFGKNILFIHANNVADNNRSGTAGAVIFHVLLQVGWTVNPHKLAAQKSPQGWCSLAVLGDLIGFAIVAGVIASDDWYYAMVTNTASLTAEPR